MHHRGRGAARHSRPGCHDRRPWGGIAVRHKRIPGADVVGVAAPRKKTTACNVQRSRRPITAPGRDAHAQRHPGHSKHVKNARTPSHPAVKAVSHQRQNSNRFPLKQHRSMVCRQGQLGVPHRSPAGSLWAQIIGTVRPRTTIPLRNTGASRGGRPGRYALQLHHRRVRKRRVTGAIAAWHPHPCPPPVVFRGGCEPKAPPPAPRGGRVHVAHKGGEGVEAPQRRGAGGDGGAAGGARRGRRRKGRHRLPVAGSLHGNDGGTPRSGSPHRSRHARGDDPPKQVAEGRPAQAGRCRPATAAARITPVTGAWGDDRPGSGGWGALHPAHCYGQRIRAGRDPVPRLSSGV